MTKGPDYDYDKRNLLPGHRYDVTYYLVTCRNA